MTQSRFIIPQKLDDLLHPQEDPSVFYVNDELTSLEVAQRLPDTESRLNQDPLAILEEFGVFFSVLKNFTDIDSRAAGRTWTIVYKTCETLQEQLREIFSVVNESVASQHGLNMSQSICGSQGAGAAANLFESLAEKLRFSNALKMLIYITCSFIELFEEALSSQSHRQNFNDSYTEATPGRKKKKKNEAAKQAAQVNFKEYDRYKEKVMKNLLQLVSLPIQKVLESSTETIDVVGQVMRVCHKMIENSAVNGLSKNKELLNYNFSLLGIGIEKHSQSLSFCLKFIQLLQYREQLAPLLAELVEFIVLRHDQRLIIGEILREIDRIDIKDLSRDSSCPRAVSTFLINLSEKCPRDFIPSLNHILGYLEQDSYIMRNASLSIITNIILKLEHDKEEDKSLRDELLDVLLAHIKDITGYTRSRALSLWCTLCDNQCIPLSYIGLALTAATGRLMDKSCLVRKNALRFVINLLSRNPYAKKLPLRTFLDKYQVEKKVLEEMTAREDEALETLSQASKKESQNDSINSETDPETVQPTLKIRNLALADESALVAQKRKVAYLEDTISFTKQIHNIIPLTTEMLISKNITDIQEAIDFFVHCHEFGIDEALIGFKRMILLINVQEKSVKDTISSAYKRIFFESSRYEGKSNREALVVANFVNFVQTSSIGEFISLEKLIALFIESDDFTKDMERELFALFTRAKSSATIEDSIAAIQLIGMIALVKPDVVAHNLQLCTQYGLNTDGCSEQNSRLIRETCIAIRKSLPKKIENKRRSMRLARDDEMFLRLEEILVKSFTNVNSEHWFSMCDEILRIFFDRAENPEKICESIYSQMVDKLLKNAVKSNVESNRESPDLVFQPSSIQATSAGASQTLATAELVDPMALARFIHFLGDVALNLAVYLEIHVLLELKVRNTSTGGDVTQHNISAHNISISSRRRSRKYGPKTGDDQNLEEEIGLGGAEAEDAEVEFITSICDEELVCGKNLLARLSKVIVEVVTDPFRFPNTELKQASALALAKFMMVSAKYCHDHLRLLFTVLEKTKDSEIKINLLVVISDLCVRFPNQLDGWTGKIFDCLQSEEVLVRRAALKILSRLVLCDILKAKDQISTMANLIVDSDEQIASYSRHFFLELSKKLNAIYNVLPDMISRLSDSKTGISEENFRIVMKFIFELIDKSHHIDRLVDKLCGRFMDTDDERHWSDLAYCLSLLKYSDKSIAKLFDKFDCYKDKLCIESVHESISSILASFRKTPHKNETKQMLDEFEAKIAKSVGESRDETEQMDQEAAEAGDKDDEEEEEDAGAAPAGEPAAGADEADADTTLDQSTGTTDTE